MSNDTSQELNTTNTRHKAVEGGPKPFGLETTVSINSHFLSASHRGLILCLLANRRTAFMQACTLKLNYLLFTAKSSLPALKHKQLLSTVAE